jgi:serine protease Do
MKNEMDLESIIEDYLNGKLSESELAAFEQMRANDSAVDQKVIMHKAFLDSLKEYASETELRSKMNILHHEIDVESLSRKLGPHPSFIINIWRKNRAAIGVAASFILLTLVMLYSIQQNTQQIGSVELVKRDLAILKNSNNNLIRKINSTAVTKNLKPANFGGTGFALTTNGYILTNLHVVDGADSVYVQDTQGNQYKVKVDRRDTQYDLAILKIIDESFKLPALPYRLKESGIGIGEDVYTLGFPKDDAVYAKGYVSSKTGYSGNDSTQYQVSIDVNPGNSGGPLLDQNGNIVGVITAKLKLVDGATFAVKSRYIQEILNMIPNDSLGSPVKLAKKNSLQGLTKSRQAEKMQDFIFMVKVYK